MKTKALVHVSLLVVFLFCVGAVRPLAAQDEVGSKGIKAEEFIKNRPSAPVARRPPKKPTYKSSQVVN